MNIEGLDPARIYEAIRSGVRDGVDSVIYRALQRECLLNQTPGRLILKAIRDGVREAHERALKAGS